MHVSSQYLCYIYAQETSIVTPLSLCRSIGVGNPATFPWEFTCCKDTDDLALADKCIILLVLFINDSPYPYLYKKAHDMGLHFLLSKFND